MGRPGKIPLTSFGHFCLIFFFLLCTFPTLSHMLSYLQRIWSWRRREPRKRTGNVLWRVSHFLFYNSTFISFISLWIMWKNSGKCKRLSCFFIIKNQRISIDKRILQLNMKKTLPLKKLFGTYFSRHLSYLLCWASKLSVFR